MAQTKPTMNLGTLVALPLEMHCKHAIETLHAVKMMNTYDPCEPKNVRKTTLEWVVES